MTRKIKQLLFSLGLGKIREMLKLMIIGVFYIWVGVKKLLTYLGLPAIIVNYDISSLKEVKKIFTLPHQPIIFHADPLFRGREQIPHYDCSVYSIDEGKVFGTYTVATKNNEIIWDLTRWPNTDTGTNLYSYKFLPKKARYLKGNVAVLSSNDSDKNYHHRITVVAAKFYLIQQAGIHIDYFITDTQLSFHKQGIQALCIPEEKIIPTDETMYYQAEHLICANNATLYGFIHPRAKDHLWKLFLNNSESKENNKKIYVKRITNRKVANEIEFEQLIQKYGFEIYAMEGRSIKEQATVFNEASIVISPHGAGLTNMVFCNPGTLIIELFHNQTIFGHYYEMAGTLGLQYIPYVGKVEKNSAIIEMDQNMLIDIEEFETMLSLHIE